MSTEVSLFANGSSWCIAGVKPNGVIYAASIDPILLEIQIWAYSNVQDKWKILTTADYLSGIAPDAHHCLISAAYNEEIGRLDVFVEIHESLAFIFRFFVGGSSANSDRVLTASDTWNIEFDGFTGPTMHFVGETLVIGGATRRDLDFRLFRVDTDRVDDPTSFKLTQMWSSEPGRFILYPKMAVVGKKVILVLELDILVFVPDDRSTKWHESITKSLKCLLPDVDEEFCCFCTSPSSDDSFWYTVADGTLHQGFVCDDGSITTRLISSVSIEDDIPWPRFAHLINKSVVVSASHVHWVHEYPTDVLMSRSFAVPSLQSLCLSAVFGTTPFKNCDCEDQAIQLGIPRLAWRGYCV